MIIDGPWASLPAGAEPGLSLDEKGFLTLRSNPTSQAFVALPDPEKGAFPNTIWDLGSSSGKLYLGYGDLYNNRGPVDIISYDPRSGALVREFPDAPDEQLGGWQVGEGGRLYVAGNDAQESWTFGNFYLNDGLIWQKRRTIYKGLHVHKIVEFRGRLYAAYGSDGYPPVAYTFVPVSANGGATWSYERTEPGATRNCAVDALAVVSHTSGSFLYAVVFRQASDGGFTGRRLYRHDGQSWAQVTVTDPGGTFTPYDLFPFGEWLLVRGQASSGAKVYALDGQGQMEVTFLRGKNVSWARCAVHDGWLYYLDVPPFGSLPTSPILYRTRDLQIWEAVGTIALLPGARAASLAFARGRLYVGAGNAGYSELSQGAFDLDAAAVPPIANATLEWEAVVPGGAQLSLRIRTATSYSGLFSQPRVGPDGTGGTAFTQSGQALHPMHDGHTWLRVTVYKTANGGGQWPLLKWVRLVTSNGAVTLAVDEGPGLYAATNVASEAEYLSPVFKLREPLAGGKLFFERVAPPGTGVRFQVRSAQSEGGLAQAPFRGPDGTSNTYYQSNGTSLWAGHDGDTCVQYRAMLSSSNPTLAPFLRRVVLAPQSDAMGDFAIEIGGPTSWRAEESVPITVTARFADGYTMPIRGRVPLSAWDVGRGEAVPIEPQELILDEGVGVANVSLQRATLTRICVSLADVTTCSAPVTVQPGMATAISVRTSLREPRLNWAPVGRVGQPFSLMLTIHDRYHNVVTDYSGTVQCQCWQWTTASAQLPPPYTFQLADQGYHQFLNGATIPSAGEWNLVCFDVADPRIAGTQTVNIQ